MLETKHSNKPKYMGSNLFLNLFVISKKIINVKREAKPKFSNQLKRKFKFNGKVFWISPF